MKNIQTKRGFIALMSAIIISVLLIAVTVSLGFSAFFTRFNILDSESKEQSGNLAEACADAAILDISQGFIPPPNTGITLENNHCTIISATATTIQIQATVNRSYTNLKVVIDGNFNVTSWQECATGPCT